MLVRLYSHYAEKPLDVELDFSHIELRIVDYSERSIAVIGKTRLFKKQFEKMGGKYNSNLKCGAGYVFSKKHQDEVEHVVSLINQIDRTEEEVFDNYCIYAK